MIEPVIKTIHVAATPDACFRRFTEEIDTWWPKSTHSVSQAKCREVRWVGPEGGEIFEIDEDGNRVVWGVFEMWDAPHRVVSTWHPGSGPETAQHVGLTFDAEGDGTLVRLEHRDFENIGENAAKTRASYNDGWQAVLELYADSFA